MPRHFIGLLLLTAVPAMAAEVALVGVIGRTAAVLAVDGGEPKTVKVGQKWNGITVLSVQKDQASIEVDGQKRLLQRGQHYRSAPPPANRETVTLAADTRGHFLTEGDINGVGVRFLVDTGSTMVALPAADAERLGIDYRKGKPGTVQTAGGPVPAYLVKLERVKIGAIELSNVDGLVVEQGLGVALLGMSFLNRVEMRREGQSMTLIRRF